MSYKCIVILMIIAGGVIGLMWGGTERISELEDENTYLREQWHQANQNSIRSIRQTQAMIRKYDSIKMIKEDAQ